MNNPNLYQAMAQSELATLDISSLIELGYPRAVAANEILIEDGSTGHTFYVVLAGALEVTQNGQFIALLEPGALFGEMSLFNNSIRAGRITAREDSEVLELEASGFMDRVLHQDPTATRLLEHLGTLMMERLQQQDAQILERAEQDNPAWKSWITSFSPLKKRLMADWALKYHAIGRPGKLAITATKPSGTPEQLSIAYSPGVAEPCLAIAATPDAAYQYTAKGQLVGVVTNGTAVLGLGNIGALASKPVMEGKAILFKRFADLDAFDIEVNELDPERFVDIVCGIAPTFGGINLEDIRAPECFEIEAACKARLDIPVFHDDQHGTAIICGAGVMNALDLVDKRIEDVKVVFSGAGAAGFACASFLLSLGVAKENLIISDVDGVVYRGRGDGNYLDELAADTNARTLGDAIIDADVFVGASVGGVLKPYMLSRMTRDPIVFALSNPTPEIDFNLARQTRSDVIVGTGRSDYPNQINNVIAFPYLFRGTLDVRARSISDEMKRAASRAIAKLARQPVTEAAGFDGADLSFGRDYLIPKPFDQRLLVEVASAVAECAMQTGEARQPVDLEKYRVKLSKLIM